MSTHTITKGGILIPAAPDAEQQKAQKKHSDELARRYNTEPELKKLADRIHASRMIPGDACEQCIEMAISRLNHIPGAGKKA